MHYEFVSIVSHNPCDNVISVARGLTLSRLSGYQADSLEYCIGT